jgi:hypothetical protein
MDITGTRTGIFAFVATLVLITGTALADTSIHVGERSVYKWVDDNGVTNYAGQPSAAHATDKTTIRFKPTDKDATNDRVQRQNDVIAAADTRRTQQSQDASQARQEKAEFEQQRAVKCDKSRATAKRYNEAHRLYRQTEDGERDYLSDQELDQERADANQSINEFCN